jgi:fermentation-respiration switch protein FrsA (DUF1100 family)
LRKGDLSDQADPSDLFVSIIRGGLILDHEASLQLRHLPGKTRSFDTAQNFGEILVGVGCLVDRVFPAVRENVGNIEIGIHGESLGCAISLSALGLTQDFKFCVADCGYSDLELLLTELIGGQMHLPKFFVKIASFFCKVTQGFWFSDVKPYKALEENQTPILFIHGDADSFINKNHSQINFDHAKSCYKELHFFPGADHAWSCMSDKEGYDKLVKEFVKKVH